MSFSIVSNASGMSVSAEKPTQNHMNLFIRAVADYVKSHCDETATRINRYLQLISVSINTAIFDPNTSVVCQFYISLHKLLTITEPRSTLSWACVNVLQTACTNQAARRELIHTYEFIPLLARLLGDQLPLAKQISLLTVIQELSCGVKISWIIPNLEHLMTSLIKYIYNEGENEQVLLLSLGIIINLCFKNLPCSYMLSKCVDIKEFLKYSATLKGPKVEVCACKLFIILDNVHGVAPDDGLIMLLKVTFASMQECFSAKDTILLRQHIEFYLEVNAASHNMRQLIEKHFVNYAERVQTILHMIKPTSKSVEADDGLLQDGECMCLIFKFLTSLVSVGLPQLEDFYVSMAGIALNWVQTEMVALDAISLIKAIVVVAVAQCSARTRTNISAEIVASMPIVIANWQSIDQDTAMTIDQCGRLSHTMDLLKMLVRNADTRDQIGEHLTIDLFDKVFTLAMIGTTDATGRTADARNLTPEAFALYINVLALLNAMSAYFSNMRLYLDGKLHHPQVHAILAEGLSSATSEIRANVLEIIAGESRTRNVCAAIADAINAETTHARLTPVTTCTSFANDNFMYSLLAAPNTSPANVAIQTLNEARANQRINVSICDVMELYEYKIAAMGHSERVVAASAEAASTACTHLRQQRAQLSAEVSRIRQLLLRNEHLLKESFGKVGALNEQLAVLNDENSASKEVQTKLKQREAEMAECIQEMEKKLQAADAKLENNKTVIATLEDSLWKMEKVKTRKQEELKNMQFELQNSNQRICEIEQLLAANEMALQQKTKILEETKFELSCRSKELAKSKKENDEHRMIIETITKLTTKNSGK